MKTFKISALLYTALLLLVSVLPINGAHSALNHNYVVTIRLDYLVHAAVYIPWVILVWLGYGNTLRTSLARMVFWIIVSLLFAIAMEAVQRLIPWRVYNVNDLLSNAIGVLTGAVAVAVGDHRKGGAGAPPE